MQKLEGSVPLSEDNSAEHSAKAIHSVLVKGLFCLTGQVHLGVHLSDAADDELFCGLLGLLLYPLIVLLGELGQTLESLHVLRLLVCVGVDFEAVGPAALVQIKQHLLLTFVLAVVDGDGVVVLVKAAHQGHCAGVVQVPDVRGGLSWLHPAHHHLLLDAAEGIDHHFAFYRLNGVDDDGNSSRVQILLLFLGLDVSA